MTHLDLFSGIGGFAIAAQACGFRTVAFCEIEPYAQQVLKEKFGAVMADAKRSAEQKSGHKTRAKLPEREAWLEPGGGDCIPVIHPDIFALNGADYLGVDLVTGGFPCQPYSCAGKRRGADDNRAIWPEMLRIIAEARPAWVLGENVPGIINMELDRVLSDLEAIGYACWPLVVPACAVDARHRRDRVWIVAHSQRDGRGPWEAECSGFRGRTSPDGTSKDVGYSQERTIGAGLCQDGSAEQRRGRSCDTSGQNMAHAKEQSSNGVRNKEANYENTGENRNNLQIGGGGNACRWPDESDWFPESPICRVANGIPHRAHRLRALGNAIVPQVAEVIIREIARLINHDFTVRIETNKPNSL